MAGLWRRLWQRRRWEDDLADELQLHLDLHAARLQKELGCSPEEAARQARLDLGSREAYREQCREAHGLRWPDELVHNLRYALRTLRRDRAFAAVALLSLTLGIGANTVVFSVLNALVWKPLPAAAAPERLVFVQPPRFPTQSYPNYRDLRDRTTTLSALFAYRITPVGLAVDGGNPVRTWAYLATGNYFDGLGIQPAIGRFYHAADERGGPGGSPYAVLSYDCWQTRFAGDPQIAGRQIRLNTQLYTVLGVAPQGFYGTELWFRPELWLPMQQQAQIEGFAWTESRSAMNIWLLGRLRDGVTLAQAQAELTSLTAGLAREHPLENEGLTLRLTQPGLLGDFFRKPAQAFASMVMLLAALVLLAACVNLASLVAARTADRHRELAIRLSIGAGRGRITRQIVTESLLLSIAGGLLGSLLAVFLLRLISTWRVPLEIPVQIPVQPDWRVIGFAFAASVLTGLLFSIAPARQIWRTQPNEALRSGGAIQFQAGGRRWTFREVLLSVQVALCGVLVCTSLVAGRNLSQALSLPVGFQPAGVSVAGVQLGLGRYNAEQGLRMQRRALELLQALPGVTAAGYSNSVPLNLDQSDSTVFPADAADFRTNHGVNSIDYSVSPGYFGAIGTRLLRGRDFTWHDDASAPLVAVVNETFARKIHGRTDATGWRFRYSAKGKPIEVIGIVEDGKYSTLTETPQPALFRPAGQSYNDTALLLVRSQRPVEEVAAEMRAVIAKLDPGLPVYNVGSLHQLIGVAFFPARSATVALGLFGVLAVMLAITGIYGMAAYTVSRRVREIGIRLAIGARPAQILNCVLGRLALFAAAGALVGLALSLVAQRWIASVVMHASTRDPFVVAGTLTALFGIGAVAGWGPTRRALSVDPLCSLRQD